MRGEGDVETVDLKYSAARGSKCELCFEPVGTTFSLFDGQSVYLRVPVDLVSKIEIVVWSNGVGVWVPYPGDYVVLDESGNELDRL